MTSTTFFIIFIPILSLILLSVNLLLAPHNPYQEKDSVFECGFHSFLGQNRTQFSVSFFIFGLLFLLFDLEILLVYPYSVSGYNNDIYGLVIMMIFFVLLTLGFVFELGKNALTIDSKQTLAYHGKDAPGSNIYLDSRVGSAPLLQSDAGGYLKKVSILLLKIKIVGAIIFSRAYFTHLKSKLFTKKTICIALTSVVIGNIVRCLFIKYGIYTPLLFHPVLFSSATAFSSFSSTIGKITVEMIFDIFEDKELAMVVGDPAVISDIPKIDTAFKMESHSGGMANKDALQTTLPDKKVEEISMLTIDFSKLDNLLNELKTNINGINEQRLKHIKEDIDVQIELLQGLSLEAQKKHIPIYMNLINNFLELKKHREFSDVVPEIKKIVELIEKDKGAPHEDLLESNPEKY
jgi:NADH-ubiquinone oxidoreductase chain 3